MQLGRSSATVSDFLSAKDQRLPWNPYSSAAVGQLILGILTVFAWPSAGPAPYAMCSGVCGCGSTDRKREPHRISTGRSAGRGKAKRRTRGVGVSAFSGTSFRYSLAGAQMMPRTVLFTGSRICQAQWLRQHARGGCRSGFVDHVHTHPRLAFPGVRAAYGFTYFPPCPCTRRSPQSAIVPRPLSYVALGQVQRSQLQVCSKTLSMSHDGWLGPLRRELGPGTPLLRLLRTSRQKLRRRKG